MLAQAWYDNHCECITQIKWGHYFKPSDIRPSFITSHELFIMNPLAQHTASELTYEMIDGKILLL